MTLAFSENRVSDFSKLAINQFTTLHQWSLPQAIEGYARNGVNAIGIVRDKLQEVGVAEAKRLLHAYDMKVTCLCVGGLLTDSDPDLFRANLDSTRRAIDEAAELNAECIVFVAARVAGGGQETCLRPAPAALRDWPRFCPTPSRRTSPWPWSPCTR